MLKTFLNCQASAMEVLGSITKTISLQRSHNHLPDPYNFHVPYNKIDKKKSSKSVVNQKARTKKNRFAMQKL